MGNVRGRYRVGKPLDEGGDLRRSIKSSLAGALGLAFSADARYAAHHQFGAPRANIPARPFLPGRELAPAWQSAFERILDNDDDPVVKLLVMTYEFDDQQLLNMLVQRPLSDRLDPTPAHAAQVADLAPVVIYDARKTRPESALPHFLDLLPVRVGAWRCHHPKAYLVVTRNCVHLLIGSMNLTASGLFANREAFCSFTWNDEALADLHVLVSFVALLESEYRNFDSASLDAVLASVRSRMDSWHVVRSDEPSPAMLLVANGFESEGAPAHAIDQLREFFRDHFGERQPDALYIVSPFFDKGAGGDFLVGEIEARFGPLPVKEVATDEAALAAR